METGVKQIDDFETLKSFSTDVVQNGTIREIRVLTRGEGYTAAPTVTIEAPHAAQSTAVATGTVVNGVLNSIEVTYGGVEYTAAPAVTISDPDTGSDTATATATVSNNKVTSITIVNPGSGYASAPTITIDPPPLYTTATATAILGDQVGVNDTEVVRIRLDNPGSGYTSPPTVTITGIGAGATAVAYIQNLDKQDSFGDNNKFKEEAADILFSEDNPFGEVN